MGLGEVAMLGFVKMSALSAVLSFGVVTAYNQMPVAAEPGQGKLYQDRVVPEAESELSTGSIGGMPPSNEAVTGGRKADRLMPGAPDGCHQQAWPYVAPSCLSRSDGRASPSRVRMITVESRAGANTSVLTRMPQTDIARR
jgi:hypothetical protein